MPRKEYTIHYIYKITCTINGKYYIGMHSTFDLEDGYMGSGKRIKRSIEKHGLENHVKEILEFLEDRSSLKEREKELVNQDLLNDSLCLNLTIGGEGGFTLEQSKKGTQSMLLKIWNDKDFIERQSKSNSKRLEKLHKEGKFKYNNFKDKTHSEETKEQMRKSQLGKQSGSKNSQFGKFWITNGKENKKVSTESEIHKGWKKGRKIKIK